MTEETLIKAKALEHRIGHLKKMIAHHKSCMDALQEANFSLARQISIEFAYLPTETWYNNEDLVEVIKAFIDGMERLIERYESELGERKQELEAL